MKIDTLALVTLTGFLSISSSYAMEKAFDPNGQYLFGDWQGQRTALEQKGIKFEANVRTDTVYLADGGYDADHAETSAQELLGVSIDFEKLMGWQGLSFQIVATARNGESLSADHIQDPSAPMLSNTQSMFGRGNQDSRLTVLTFEKNFKDLGLSIKAGRMGMGIDFDYMPCDFENLAFCAAQMKWQNQFWKNAPVAQWGARIKYELAPQWSASIGVFESNPDDSNAKLEEQGWSMDSKHADGVTLPVELLWKPKLFQDQLAGTYRFGAFYNTSDDPINQKDIKTNAPENRTFGGWIAIEQQLTAKHGTGKQGLHGFANFTWHDRATTKVDQSQQIGMKYYGVWDAQPNDFLGFAVNRTQLNQRFREGQMAQGNQQFNAEAEYNIELNYNAYVTPWLSLLPNLQYIVHPGGTRNVNNAFVVGIGSKIVF
ncbi:carbohydrate porin [Acinetobacter lanii]|uniref:Carbohydrate porin n=1 Tax=Acinetobacter lanii TaxID=2715163 RepID=A0A6G8S1R9_9GAMM|nr:carbohydrate porin [Acinetobacter lanii]QIO08064.1 carbohydrate porin [Acinetobacter lanii]